MRLGIRLSILVISPTILVTRIVVVSDAFCFLQWCIRLHNPSHNPIHNPATILVILRKYEVVCLVVVVLFSSWVSVYE